MTSLSSGRPPVVVFDLDDTLFPEMDYVESSYREICRRFGSGLLPAMLSASSPRQAFDSTGLPVEMLLEIYRTHRPDIRLPWESLYTLAALSGLGYELALITDGRSVTQRGKIEALGLRRFISDDLIFISEEVGETKDTGASARRVMQLRPCRHYVYVGDNPAKDFAVPRSLGWTTVALLDRGRNIFPQGFEECLPEARPDFCVRSLLELLDGDGPLRHLF